MDEIKEIEIMMPIKVLYEGCRNCERMEIRINTNKLFGNEEMISAQNELRCAYVYQCKNYAEMVRKIMEKE